MAKGYSTSADILTRTRDGQDLNAIWRDYATALDAFNATRTPLVDLLSGGITTVIEDLVQPGTNRFEEASEFGIPKSIRPTPTTTQRAYPFKWYDMRAAYTFQFLSGGSNGEGASAAQLDNVLNSAMEAHNALLFERVMKALFNSANRTATVGGNPYTVTALYNADSSYIPPYKGQTFDGSSHTHYLASGAADLDSTDITDLATHVEHHGHTRAEGYNVILLMNPAEADVIATFRRGVENNNSQTSLYDFIPSVGNNFSLMLPPGYTLVGGLAPTEFAGLEVAGSWGPYLVIKDYQIPAGYVVAAATAGMNSSMNIVGIREHAEASLRGLILRPGNNNAYPLIDSYFIAGLGEGVRQRGAAAIMKLTASSWSVPSTYAW
jgi:hypothetical protein